MNDKPIVIECCRCNLQIQITKKEHKKLTNNKHMYYVLCNACSSYIYSIMGG